MSPAEKRDDLLSIKGIVGELDPEGLALSLRSIPKDTEEEFLRIGSALHELSLWAKEMIEDSNKIYSCALLEMKEAGEALSITELHQVFQKAVQDVDESNKAVSKGLSLIQGIDEQLSILPKINKSLESIGKSIRMLGINMKIESARAGTHGYGFQSLAVEVADLSDVVRQNAEEFSEHAKSAWDATQKFLTSITNENKSSGGDTNNLQDTISSLLKELKDYMDLSVEISESLSESTKGIYDGINKVVIAMQFHDITRQQLENVASSLMDLKNKHYEDGQGAELHQILSIQAAHLDSITEQILKAQQGIVHGLEEVKEKVSRQAETALKMVNAGGTGSDVSLVERLNHEMERVNEVLENNAELSSRLQEIIDDVAERSVQMSGFITEIEKIAEKVKLLALNALAEATRTWEQGGALRVLAQEIHHVSMDTEKVTESAIEHLKSISESTEGCTVFSKELEERHSASKAIAAQAVEFSAALRSASQELQVLSRRLDENSRHVLREVTDLIPSITFPSYMKEKIQTARERIGSAIQRLEELSPELEGKSYSVSGLEQLTARYVMEKEREVFKQVVGSQEGPVSRAEEPEVELFVTPEEGDPVPPSLSGASAGEEDLGDNVELF